MENILWLIFKGKDKEWKFKIDVDREFLNDLHNGDLSDMRIHDNTEVIDRFNNALDFLRDLEK
jgi:hypothetical protein